MAQQAQVIRALGRKPMHYLDVARKTNILIPNVRRILGQGTLSGTFERTAPGTYRNAK